MSLTARRDGIDDRICGLDLVPKIISSSRARRAAAARIARDPAPTRAAVASPILSNGSISSITRPFEVSRGG